MAKIFRDRAEAGVALAAALEEYAGRNDIMVLGLPRGGVPVAFEVAKSLKAPLDVFVVRKLGVPGQSELAMGAVASGGIRVFNHDVLESLHITNEEIERITQRENAELKRREAIYREGRPMKKIEGKTIIIIDDGLATGATMRAAVTALRHFGPREIITASPVCSSVAQENLGDAPDRVLCVALPEPFFAIGQWYGNFDQTSDEEVKKLLEQSQ
jgi:putative phosphoribosyl transferase